MINKIIFVSVLSMGLSACGGGGGSDNSVAPDVTIPPVILEGVFIDSPVENLHYQTTSQSGTTSMNGEFSYQEGEKIVFSIGNITFPEIDAKAVISPLDLFSTQRINNISVLNSIRLLQSLDEDADPLNGILIPEKAHELAAGLTVDFSSLNFDSLVATFVSDSGGVNKQLIDNATATAHFQMSLADLDLPYTNGCEKTHETVGHSGTFETFHHNVSGKATIIDDCTIEISQFDYDGGGPDVYFYGAINHDYTGNSAFAIGEKINGTVYNNSTILLTLPSNKTLDDLNGLSVWCQDVNVNFGQVTFTP
jgi:hypothetical protein